MKKYLVTLMPVLMLSFQPDLPSNGAVGHASSLQTSSQSPTADDLKPTVSQERVEQLVAKLLTTYHYRKVRLNDSLSSVVWDNYLKELDGNKTYLLASDVASFEKYRYQIDDALINGDLTAAYDLYNVFRKRFKERSDFVKEQLKKPFTFTEDETFNTDREKAPWPKTVEEQNDVWRKILKNQELELRLGNRKDSAVVATMNQRYANLDKAYNRIKSADVFQIYMNSFAEALDPHTNYFSPTNADRFNQEMSQSLEGIGAMLQEDGEYIKITQVLPGGPAFKSNLIKVNDKIAGVAQGDNGPMVNTMNWQVDEVVKLIKGPKGTVVRLQIVSPDAIAGAPPKELRLVREKIKLEEQRAKKEIIEVTDNGKPFKIGVINIPMFYRDFEGARKREEGFSSTTSDVKKFVEELKGEKVDGIVIDLRDNGGGSLTEAIDLTGIFIPKGPVVQVKESSGETEVYADKDGGTTVYNGPMAVLVNRFSASASEIFAAAIQDYKRGIIVGGQTFGKGTVQTLIDLNQWLPKEPEKVGQVKMTIQKFYRINGSSTQHKGVTPDVELPSAFSAEEYGESSQPSALPWDHINSTRYELSNDLDDKVLTRLRDRFEQRLKSDPELKKLAQDLADFKKAKENTVVSLQESKRRKEREEAERKRAAANKVSQMSATTDETGTPSTAATAKKKKDLYLNEAGLVLADYILASNLAVNKKM
ncbi:MULTISPECIES: carboxy terminal-processing peptidase [unclassified Spirosoma]|uniref:carboxy terminal-processing peptidase n=1 Tax=unclassified Spirosoma TaxID=2621999 RepID=UPI000967E718|nr:MULTISPECIES: carboxy terminal-processing peptidase [unclassified Spirosoma]MBN8823225.1 carboxy terminal-processing peptidase [Spirosoma sp.]OJW72626.1 MAG: tail-specific protease [Spirosoma sp. 48-14]